MVQTPRNQLIPLSICVRLTSGGDAIRASSSEYNNYLFDKITDELYYHLYVGRFSLALTCRWHGSHLSFGRYQWVVKYTRKVKLKRWAIITIKPQRYAIVKGASQLERLH